MAMTPANMPALMKPNIRMRDYGTAVDGVVQPQRSKRLAKDASLGNMGSMGSRKSQMAGMRKKMMDEKMMNK